MVSSMVPPTHRVPIGLSATGGVFCFDPFVLYEKGYIQNPNVFILGQIGRGKSSLVKTFLNRVAEVGASFLVIDPKGEYRGLDELVGAEVITPGVLSEDGIELFAEIDNTTPEGLSEVVGHATRISEAVLRRRVLPTERYVLALSAKAMAKPSLDHLIGQLSSIAKGTTGANLQESDSHDLCGAAFTLATELARLTDGDLRGVFVSGGERREISERCVIDLSGALGTEALPIAINTLLWQRQHQIRSGDCPQGYIVIDEAWAVLQDDQTAEWFRGLWKLSRAYGSANIAVTHRISDLGGDGEYVSQHERSALGLAKDTEIFIVYSQPPSEIGFASSFLGIEREIAEQLPLLGRGSALWRIKDKNFLVHHALHASERGLVDTDSKMNS